MKFFKTREENHLAAVIMDPARTGEVMASFIGGEFETCDAEVCAKLVDMGYRHEGTMPAGAELSEDGTNEGGEQGSDEDTGEGVGAGTGDAEIGSEADELPENPTKAEIAAFGKSKYGIDIAVNQTKDEMLVLLQVAQSAAAGEGA